MVWRCGAKMVKIEVPLYLFIPKDGLIIKYETEYEKLEKSNNN